MKAAVRQKYGLPGDLGVKELSIPAPKENEILIRVHASTVNRSDCHILSGKPLVMRLFTGLFKPRNAIGGSDFAGEVKAVGSSVTSFKAGDRIMGFNGGLGHGAHSQYMILSEQRAQKVMVPMPSNIGYEEAAACLEGAVYASGINHLGIQPEHKVMVYGATGAIGVAYMQFLKGHGAEVTAVCRGGHMELVRSWGAKKVIDYETEDFRNDDEHYDFIFDAVGKISFAECKKLLKPN
ncbi:MAG: NAD(P)-dependent alcohol dehydrogenase, partial [Chitinophagaceae bacterium]|nr:NAD(P)-dependent alcohol dehydrogenase [Chitinophagaceae bacterium]